MKIDRNNYEVYFIDYLEGKLDEKLVDDFIEFLQQNHDLKEELSLFEPVSLQPENNVFNKKNTLYKEVFDREDEFNRAAIAKLEGDLTEPEKSVFEDYLTKHPEKQKEADLFVKTKLVSDETVVFSKKSKLYRKPAGKTILLWTVRIAAVLILAIVFYILTKQPENPLSDENKTAQAINEIPGNKNLTEAEKSVTEITVKEETNPLLANVSETEEAKPKPVQNEIPHKPVENLAGTENIIIERAPVEIPAPINPLFASLENQTQQVSLASSNYKVPQPENTENEERFFADVVKEKTGIYNLTFGKIKKAGLNLVAGFTKDNFSYEITEDGRISEINYDSRLLAFTIPTGSEKSEKAEK